MSKTEQNLAHIETITGGRGEGLQKTAASRVDEYLQTTAREDGICRKIMGVEPVTPDDLDQRIESNDPVIIREVEPETNASYSLAIGGAPLNDYIDAPKYEILFSRLATRRSYADVATLYTFKMDIEQIYNDLHLKNLLDEEDRKFFLSADNSIGTKDDTTAGNTRFGRTGAKGWNSLGTMTRGALMNSMKGIPSCKNRLTASKALVNNLFIYDIASLDRVALGGDIAEKLLFDGVADVSILGLDFCVTIKHQFVGNEDMYLFADEKYIGEFCVLEDVTVSVKKESYLFETFAYEMVGGTLKNEAAYCKASFNGTKAAWNA